MCVSAEGVVQSVLVGEFSASTWLSEKVSRVVEPLRISVLQLDNYVLAQAESFASKKD